MKDLKNKMKKAAVAVFVIILSPLLTQIWVPDFYHYLIGKYFSGPLLTEPSAAMGFNFSKWGYSKNSKIKSGKYFKIENSNYLSFFKDNILPKQIEVSYDFFARNGAGEQIQIEEANGLNATFPSAWIKEKERITKTVDDISVPNNGLIFLKDKALLKIAYVVTYDIPYDDPETFNRDIENLSEYVEPRMDYSVAFPAGRKIKFKILNKIKLKDQINEMYVKGINDLQVQLDKTVLNGDPITIFSGLNLK